MSPLARGHPRASPVGGRIRVDDGPLPTPKPRPDPAPRAPFCEAAGYRGRMSCTLPTLLLLFAGAVALRPLASVVRRPTSALRLMAEAFGTTLAVVGAVWLGWRLAPAPVLSVHPPQFLAQRPPPSGQVPKV